MNQMELLELESMIANKKSTFGYPEISETYIKKRRRTLENAAVVIESLLKQGWLLSDIKINDYKNEDITIIKIAIRNKLVWSSK